MIDYQISFANKSAVNWWRGWEIVLDILNTVNHGNIYHDFTPATLASAGISCRVSVRPSVCVSQFGVLLKRLNVESRKQRQRF